MILAADGLAVLESRRASKGDEGRIGKGVFGVNKISHKFSLRGVMTRHDGVTQVSFLSHFWCSLRGLDDGAMTGARQSVIDVMIP